MHGNSIGQSMSTVFDPDYSTPSPQKSPPDLRAASSATSNTSEETQKKYVQERDKRLKEDGPNQCVDLLSDEKLKHFSQDCWLAEDNDQSSLPLEDGSHHRALVIGAGYGGLLFAVRLIEAGFEPKDITIVDSAGGFGGTWYWNRYPGLKCDVESYIYMPLLEETGYMPKNRYAYGTELRDHANRIAAHWNLKDRALFTTEVQSMTWNDTENDWNLKLRQHGQEQQFQDAVISADYVLLSGGVLQRPKMSQFKGIESFTGTCFHTARWNYESTGGSPEDSSLVKLKDKRVGIIGTGATAIQVVPQLAKWSKELFVFQRTPSSVDIRGQRATDTQEFSHISTNKGWQNIRTKNFNSFISNIKPSPAINMVNDEWTLFPSFSGLLGGPQTVTLDNVTQFVADLHALDLPRQERLRNRIEEVVTEQSVAELLKPWYAGWCKRPCFHDEYLPAFNNPHVTLVDTAGKGVDCINETGVMISGKQYDLDIIVFSTGFFVDAKASIPKRLGIDVFGRNALFLEDKWQKGVATLHGIITRDFPNLFFASEQQGPAAVNYVSCLDIAARHAAYIITEAQKRFGQHMKMTIEPTRDAEAAWSERIAAGATGLTALAGCTPGYYNLEGSADKLSAQAKLTMLRSASWPNGINDFCDVIESWHQAGDLNELDIRGLEQ